MEERKIVRAVKSEVSHNVIMENRKKLSVSGVEDVESFNDEEIILHTDLGTLMVRGSELHINKLSVEIGEVVVEGDIKCVEYDDSSKSKGGSLLSRMFK